MSVRERVHAVSSFPARPLLVAGGAGFLGSHLCERLLRDGHAVLCLDDFTTGTRTNVEALLDAPAYRFVDHDVMKPLRLDVGGVFNLACPASPAHYRMQPVRTTLTSVEGTYNLLTLAHWCDAPYFQASTADVYGEAQQHPQTEASWGHVNSTGTRSCYDEGQRCAESLCFDFQRQHGVPVKVARIFSTYGPRMQINDGRVVSNFIVQALRNDPITIYGDGSQTRAFCYVDDMVDGIVKLMQAPAAVTGPLNLGNPEEHSIRHLAERIVEITGSRSPLVHRPLPADDPTQRRPDISQAQQALHWRPSVSLDEGLRRTAEYFEDELTLVMAPSRVRALAARGPRLHLSHGQQKGALHVHH
jgi:UDP-glucuronate decarboxylase